MRTQEQDLLMLCKCICCVSFSKFSVLMVYSLALHRNCVRQFLTYDAITIRYRRQWRRMVKNVVGEAEPAKWQLVPQSPSTPASQPPSLSASQPLSLPASHSLNLPFLQRHRLEENCFKIVSFYHEIVSKLVRLKPHEPQCLRRPCLKVRHFWYVFFDNAAKASLIAKSTYVRIFTKSSSVCQSMDRAFLFRG